MPNRKQQRNLSKEQIASQMQMAEKNNRLKKIIRDKVYPHLEKAENLGGAKVICQVVATIADAKIKNYWADKKFSELGLVEELQNDESAQDLQIYTDLLQDLGDEDITDVQEIMSTMGGALDNHVLKDAKNLPLPAVTEIIND